VPPPETRLAVDLSGGLIRVLAGVMGGPIRSGSAGMPAGAIVGGRVQDPVGVGTALKQLLARNEIVETRALVAASDSVATFRVLKFPPGTPDSDIDSSVARELPLDPNRMATRWIDVHRTADMRQVYAASWDRAQVKNVSEAARLAGLDSVVVELKSTCVARAVAEPSCVVVDMSSDPMEAILIDGWVPHVWHSFRADATLGDDLAPALASPLRSVLRFYKRRRDTNFASSCPVLISGEQMLPTQVVSKLSEMIGHPVQPLPMPTRVGAEIRHTTYLTCLGLLMRRTW
jgi:hypothetical protein